jgi:D-galactose 1-dehydrogenase
MIGIGIVGLGHVAAHQIEALKYCNGLRLVAGCDTDTAALGQLPGNTGRYERLQELLDDKQVDVVVIASPNSLHVEHSKLVIASGKRLVLEKPIAIARRDAEQLATARSQFNARCTIALHAAFGLEVEWLCDRLEKDAIDRHSILRITSGFYDPYFSDGVLLDHARSLSGSWLDSGINALSVIDRLLDGKKLSLTDSRMTRVTACDCSEVQGSVEFCFPSTAGIATGLIDTNWTIGRNSKKTSLHMVDGKTTVIADHSAQCVYVNDNRGTRTLYQCDNGRARLTNHYIGVFTDLLRQIREDRDNFETSIALHDLVYAAEEWDPTSAGHRP